VTVKALLQKLTTKLYGNSSFTTLLLDHLVSWEGEANFEKLQAVSTKRQDEEKHKQRVLREALPHLLRA
jgi:hypothetical protein